MDGVDATNTTDADDDSTERNDASDRVDAVRPSGTTDGGDVVGRVDTGERIDTVDAGGAGDGGDGDTVDAVAAAFDGARVVVTGGAGFVGSHLARRLADRCELSVVDDFSTGSRSAVPDAATVVEGDVRDAATVRAATEGADVIFHQAAVSSVPASFDRPAATETANVVGTIRVLEAARRTDARVVVASSAAVYGDPTTLPVAETARAAPRSPYGIGKLAADWYTRLYADRYGLAAVPLRYFNVYGPGCRGVVAAFLEQARTGGPITVEGDGEQTRDFVFVEDVVRANLLAATTDATGRAYNVGTGEAVTIRRLARLVGEATGTDATVTHVDARPGDVRHSRAAIDRARDGLGFEPRVSLREGLARTVAATDGP